MTREGHTEKVISEQTPEGDGAVSYPRDEYFR